MESGLQELKFSRYNQKVELSGKLFLYNRFKKFHQQVRNFQRIYDTSEVMNSFIESLKLDSTERTIPVYDISFIQEYLF